MKLPDIAHTSREDVLDFLGLERKHSDMGKIFGSFGIGVLLGAGVALLLAPKPGSELRQDLYTKIGRHGTDLLAAGTEALGVSESVPPSLRA